MRAKYVDIHRREFKRLGNFGALGRSVSDDER